MNTAIRNTWQSDVRNIYTAQTKSETKNKAN